VYSVSTLLCFLYTRLFGICLLLYGRVCVASTAWDWKKDGDGQFLPPCWSGMVSCWTHKFPSGHRSASMGVSWRCGCSCQATTWQKKNKNLFVDGHKLLACLYGRSAWTISLQFLLVEQLALVYELSCSKLLWVDSFDSRRYLAPPCFRSRIELDGMLCSLRPFVPFLPLVI